MERGDSKDRRQLVELIERVWGQALLAVSTAEEEASRMVAKLTGAAGWTQDEARKYVRDLTERLGAQRKEMERGVEETVGRTLRGFRVPRRDEIQALNTRLDDIGRRIDSLGHLTTDDTRA